MEGQLTLVLSNINVSFLIFYDDFPLKFAFFYLKWLQFAMFRFRNKHRESQVVDLVLNNEVM